MCVSIHGSILKYVSVSRAKRLRLGGSANPRQKLNEGKEGSWDSRDGRAESCRLQTALRVADVTKNDVNLLLLEMSDSRKHVEILVNLSA